LGKDEQLIEFTLDRPGHDLRYAVDTIKIETELGWKPKVSFEEGLKKTVEWYLNNKSWLFEKKRYIDNFIQRIKIEYKKMNSR